MTHPDLTAFLNAIHDNPDDDTPRLVFADWLDDQREHARAAFIRATVERFRLCERFAAGLATADDARRFRETLREKEGSGYSANLPAGVEWEWADNKQRGMVEVIACAAEAWLAHGDAITAEHPVREVTLTTEPQVRMSEVSFDHSRRVWTFSLAGKELKVTEEEYLLAGDGPQAARVVLAKRWPRVKVWNLPPEVSGFGVLPNERGDFRSWSDEALLIWAEHNQPVSTRVMNELRRRGLVDRTGRRIDAPAV